MKEKAIILCNGQMPPKELLEKYLADTHYFVAADGGANRAAEIGLFPEVVIGDFDSFDEKLFENRNIQKVHLRDQETNDLEKALNWLLEKKIRKIEVFGATNMRMDHSLKNLSVMLRYRDEFESLIFRDEYGYCFLLPKRFSAPYSIGQPLSLIPLNGRVEGITTEGLKYGLNNEFLENGIRDGSSNEAIQERVLIEYLKGDLLLYVASVNQ